MRQYMAMMQQAMGMHTMNGSSSRQKKAQAPSNLQTQIFKSSINSSKVQKLHQLLENFQGLGVEYGLGKRGRVRRLVVRRSRHGFGKTQFIENQIS